jgi:hypothetical protein
MADPLTLTAVGSMVLTEGIKFLYSQAGEVIKRWREGSGSAQRSEPVAAPPTAALAGQLAPLAFEYDHVATHERDLRALRQGLADFVDGIDPVDPGDQDLLVRVDALRGLLESIYGQRITFQGEARPTSGTPVVAGSVDVSTIAGQASGVEAGRIASGEVRGQVRGERVEPGGDAAGVRVDTVGGG